MWRLLILCGDNFVSDYLKKLTYGWLFLQNNTPGRNIFAAIFFLSFNCSSNTVVNLYHEIITVNCFVLT